ncbi:MAG: hypothetical protein A3H29_12280 [Acidobacteria bacterium RIFCSPLOWO2_02_FULL_67_21]|nr:MAG: hypothetical protein A3H29_12280 [Acidobacteria bacterium RIFCSPLOWO2_02_FULL_67_21]
MNSGWPRSNRFCPTTESSNDGCRRHPYVEPRDLRQLRVEQDEAWRFLECAPGVQPAAEDKVERFLAVTGHRDLLGQLLAAQREHRQLHVVNVVFHEQNLDVLIRHGRSFLERV